MFLMLVYGNKRGILHGIGFKECYKAGKNSVEGVRLSTKTLILVVVILLEYWKGWFARLELDDRRCLAAAMIASDELLQEECLIQSLLDRHCAKLVRSWFLD